MRRAYEHSDSERQPHQIIQSPVFTEIGLVTEFCRPTPSPGGHIRFAPWPSPPGQAVQAAAPLLARRRALRQARGKLCQNVQ